MTRNTLLALALVAGLSPALAGAKNDYIAIEQRLTAEQRHATGLDTLSAEQLALLNQLLREGSPAPAAAIARDDDAPKERVLMGLDEGPISGKLKGSLTLRKPLVSPDILVVPGVAGRWFFQVDEDLPKARVYRID
jgi:hypothetical protein